MSVNPLPRRTSSERGQFMVIVAVGMIAFLAAAGLVIDTGLSWANRRQAQNVADAAALSGARVIATDRYQKVYDPTATPVFANPGAAVQTAINAALRYNANAGQTFQPMTWGSPGSPEYTDYRGRRFPNVDFATGGPLYVASGTIPGEAQGVWVPVETQANTLVMQIVGISTVSLDADAKAIAGPNVPLGKLLPLVVRDRYTQCADQACLAPQGPPPAVYGQNVPLPGPVPYQRTFQEGCQYNFRQTNPGEVSCLGITDPSSNSIGSPGNFGWLSWTGGPPANSSLVDWIRDPLSAPIDWYATECSDPNASETCHVAENLLPRPRDDEFWRLAGTTGNKQSALDELASLYIDQEVYVPIWRSSLDPGNGAHAQFDIIGFAVFRVDTVIRTGSNKGFTGTFIGSFRGGDIQRCTIIPASPSCPGSGSAPFSFAVNLAD